MRDVRASHRFYHPSNCIDARNADQAGGDAFDLQDIELTEAQFIRIQDAGVSGPGGFDLDAAVQALGVLPNMDDRSD